MAETELQEARRRFNEVSQRVRSNGDNWADFLTCAARNHKYEFQDQLLIFDQQPDATACADLNLWKNHFNRSVEKETKSIKLLRANAQSVFNVFDISDTRPDFGHQFDEPPYIWQIEPEDFKDISESLNQAYGFSSELGTQIAAISKNFAQNLERNGDSLYSNADTSEERHQLTDLLTNSVEYYLRTRCGLEIQRENFSFENISELDASTVMRLGTITSGFSRQVLDNVERVVRVNHERRKLENGQSGNSADSVSRELNDGRGDKSGRSESISGIGNEAGGRHDDLSRSGVDPVGESGLAGRQSVEGNGRRNDLRESSGHLDAVPNA
ncbi:MAG: hypothetical protein IJ859_12635, partial [Synergistaceae bacterium]|nr:hypothetical protein [Synergistaceae bacterium]